MSGQGELVGESFVVWRAADPRASLVCVPHAGGGPAAFHSFAGSLPPSLETWVLRLPGREGRITEPPVTLWDELVGQVAEDIARSVRLPYVLMGNCSGSILAFSCARELARRGRPPGALIVCDHPAPDAVDVASFGHLARAPSSELWSKIGALGGTPASVVEHDGLRSLLETGLRGDCLALAGFREPAGAEPLEVPVAVIACQDSIIAGQGQMLRWGNHTRSWFVRLILEGNHWLLQNPDFPAAVSRICSFLLSADEAGNAR